MAAILVLSPARYLKDYKKRDMSIYSRNLKFGIAIFESIGGVILVAIRVASG
jgi:hypothetical protein